MFFNSPRSLPINLLHFIILEICVFDNSIVADKLFAKTLRILAISPLVSNTLPGKLCLSLELPM